MRESGYYWVKLFPEDNYKHSVEITCPEAYGKWVIGTYNNYTNSIPFWTLDICDEPLYDNHFSEIGDAVETPAKYKDDAWGNQCTPTS